MTPARIAAALLAVTCLVACGGDDRADGDASGAETSTAARSDGGGSADGAGSFEFDPAGARSLGCTTSSGDVDESLTAGDADCIASLWSTEQLDTAVEAKDCATIAAVEDYASSHGEIEHDGPIAAYAELAGEENGC